jgi:uncharacterized RDD family membrane protein YckC
MVDEEAPQFAFLGQYAGFVTRLAAFAVDRAVVASIVLVIALAVRLAVEAFYINQILGLGESLRQVVSSYAIGAYLMVSALYDVGFWLLVGQTPGKWLMGVRVVRTDGERLRLGNALRRVLAYALSGILFLGYVWILFDNRRQGFHDKLAGTIVVYSWPEAELSGTFVRDQVLRIVAERQMSQRRETQI